MITFIKSLNTDEGQKHLFVDNPIILHAEKPDSDDLIFFVDLTLLPESEVKRLEGVFMGDACIIDLAEYLRAYVSLHIPDITTYDLQYAKSHKKPFSVTYGSKNRAGEVIDAATALGGQFDAYLGGHYIEQFPNPPRYFTLLSQNLENRKIKPENLKYEYFYCTGLGAQIRFTYHIYNYVGAIVTNVQDQLTSFESANRVMIMPLWKLLESEDLSNTWRIVVKIKDLTTDNEHTLTYEIDRTIRRNERLFFFQNSLGGMDTVCFTGERTKLIEVEQKTAEKNLDYRYKKSDSRKQAFKTEKQTSFKMETGYKTRAELDYLQREFLPSPQIYEIVDNQLLAILLTTKKLDYEQNSVKPQSLSLEYQYTL